MNKLETLQVRTKILEILTPFYMDYGFKPIVKLANFKSNDKLVLWGESSNHIDSLVFRPQLWIENRNIKKILKTIFPSQIGFMSVCRGQSIMLIEEMKIEDYSSDFIVKHSDGSRSYYYDIGLETDVRPIAEDHIGFMQKIGFPFFDKLSTLEGISDYFNYKILELNMDSELDDPWSSSTFTLDKRDVLSAIISAYLMSLPETNLLVERYRILLQKNDFILKDLEKVVGYFED